MSEVIIMESLELELMAAEEATYIDSAGAVQSAFTNDETVIRSLTEHDLVLRHPQSVAVIQGVRWQPTMS
jgi:hypothetical protein